MLVYWSTNLLEEEGLIRRTSSLGHEEEVVLVGVGLLVAAAARVQLDLGGQVAAGVLLAKHVLRAHLAVTKILHLQQTEHKHKEGTNGEAAEK